MNYLAHIYLSGDDDEILIGNFMGDDVKGKNYMNYPPRIRQGILLHRYIDSETDKHPATSAMKQLLRPEFGIFSGIISDIFYDYFLAFYWRDFHAVSLKEYTLEKYHTLEKHNGLLPQKTAYMLHYMIKKDWLFNYQYEEGIHRALKGMGQRISSKPNLEEATSTLNKHKAAFENCFFEFMPHIVKGCEEQLKG